MRSQDSLSSDLRAKADAGDVDAIEEAAQHYFDRIKDHELDVEPFKKYTALGLDQKSYQCARLLWRYHDLALTEDSDASLAPKYCYMSYIYCSDKDPNKSYLLHECGNLLNEGALPKEAAENTLDKLKVSAQSGDPDSAYLLYCILQKREDDKSSDSHLYLLQFASAKEVTEAMVDLGHYYEQHAKYKEAFDLYTKVEKLNDPSRFIGVYNLARCYAFGIGTEKNNELANRLFDESKELAEYMYENNQSKAAKRILELLIDDTGKA
ncbi:MAG: hypothetical protein AAGK14_05165 [Verrucomicrobiota bacterium]